MSIFDYLLLVLGAWYLAWALVYGQVFVWLRKRTKLYGLLDCIYCTGFWVGVGVYVVYLVFPHGVNMLAIAGGVMIAERIARG